MVNVFLFDQSCANLFTNSPCATPPFHSTAPHILHTFHLQPSLCTSYERNFEKNNIRWTQLVGGLEHFLFFPYIGNNHPNWLIFSEKCKSDGKVHTSGYIKGGKIAMSFPANRMLGVAFVGRNHVLSNWKFLFNSISWSLFFLFSWWLRRESRFFDARGLRDRVLRVRTPPALCEQLTNIFQRGWNHQPVTSDSASQEPSDHSGSHSNHWYQCMDPNLMTPWPTDGLAMCT